MLRYKKLYQEVILPSLLAEYSYTNVHQVPKINKVVLNMGVGKAVSDSKLVAAAAVDLASISGQKPLIISSKKSIAAFKLREGMKIGCKVTLRADRMYDFLERLVLVALPRVKEFRGLSSGGFDGRGNFSFGIKEQVIFPEINYDRIDMVRGLDVTFVTTASSDQEARSLLSGFNLPFC
jgi:large subunit ribosomal protein L5